VICAVYMLKFVYSRIIYDLIYSLLWKGTMHGTFVTPIIVIYGGLQKPVKCVDPYNYVIHSKARV